MKNYKEIAKKLGNLVTEKNKAYGDSFKKAGEILKILYPGGIKKENYSDVLLIARILDKLFRIATNKDALGEDPYLDIAGYGILGVEKEI